MKELGVIVLDHDHEGRVEVVAAFRAATIAAIERCRVQRTVEHRRKSVRRKFEAAKVADLVRLAATAGIAERHRSRCGGARSVEDLTSTDSVGVNHNG